MDVATFEDETLGRDAVVLGTLVAGTWEQACAVAVRGTVDADPARVATLEDDFRRERRLWAAEDMARWLAVRDVTVGEWRAHIARLASADAAPAVARRPEQERAAWLALVLDGAARASAERLLAGAAATALLGAGAPAGDAVDQGAASLARAAMRDPVLPLEDRHPDAIAAAAVQVTRLGAAFDRSCARLPERDVARAIAERRSAWTRLDYEQLVLRSEPEAREAVMCVREDGLDLNAIGALAAARPAAVHAIAEDAPDVAERLLAAAPGDALDPMPARGGFGVIVLRSRRPPRPADPAIAARARRALAAERAARRLAGRVRWHVEL